MATLKTPPPQNYLQVITALIQSGAEEIAMNKVREWGLKIEIKNGKILDMSDTTEAWLARFITINNQMMVMKDKVRKLSKVDDEVLISGESGTGKEIIAHALHGDRIGRFVGVNCAGIPEQLVESLLFGHVKGSFTGATDTRVGYMQLAKDGILFLDEVGELPLQTQAKLLRAIQEKKIMKVGGDKEEDINCRIVCATHRDLWKMVSANQFRLDLYARLSTFEINILPLWRRPDDVMLIITSIEGGQELWDKLKEDKSSFIYDSNQIHLQEAIPLNVRSLQQMVKRYKVLGELPT